MNSQLSTRAIVFFCTFVCCSGYLTAQAREPDIWIDTGGISIQDIQFSASGDYLFLFGHDSVQRFDLARRQIDLQLSIPNRIGDTYTINSDATRLARVDYEMREVQVIDLGSGDVLNTLSYPTEAVFLEDKILFSDDDSHLVVLRDTDGLYVAEGTWGMWRMIRIPGISELVLSESGRLVVVKRGYTTGDHLEVRASYVSEADTRRTFSGFLRNLSLSSDGAKLLLMETTYVYDGDDVQHAKEVWYELDAETLIALDDPWVSPYGGWLTRDTKELVYTYGAWLGNRPIALYKSSTGPGVTVFDVRERSVLLSRSDVRPQNITFSPTGGHLAFTYSGGGLLEVYTLGEPPEEKSAAQISTDNEGSLPQLVPQLQHRESVSGLAISADGRIVMMASQDGWVSLWDRASGREFRRLSYGVPINATALSQDGLQLLTVDLHGEGAVWDVKSGQLRRRFGSGNDTLFVAFLDDDKRALMCERSNRCSIHSLSSDGYDRGGIRLQLGKGKQDYSTRAVSLAPDEASIALALGTEGVGWMELNADGRQRIVDVPGDVEVTAVAAMGDARIVAALSDGDVLLIDATNGRIVNDLRTREARIGTIIRLDDERLAIASHGQARDGHPDDPHGEILVVSSKDLLVLQRLTWSQSMSGVDRPSSAFIELLAASGDGRWLVSASTNVGGPSLVQVWDTTISQTAGLLRSSVIPTSRVEFGSQSDYLLVDSESVATLWHVKNGNVTRQFLHHSGLGKPVVTLADNELVYLSDELSAKQWSLHSGLRNLEIPEKITSALYTTLSADGSLVAWLISGTEESEEIFSFPTISRLILLSLDERGGEPLTRINRDSLFTATVCLDAESNQAVLGRAEGGVELLDASSGESIWLRGDIKSSFDVMFTSDRTGIIVMTTDDRLLVLEAGTGETRLSLQDSDFFDDHFPGRQHSVPVFSDAGVQGILRLTQSHVDASPRLERLSLRNGSVIDTPNLGIASLAFAVSDRNGEKWLVVSEGVSRHRSVVLWDTFGSKMLVAARPAGDAESVAFTTDGRLMAIVETDGTVSLWDVSDGPAGLRRLAQLITFRDGGWAVVAPDGRYDASDPADLEGLSWVLPDAPTEPVSLTIFYREYYEPRLLPRLLAGEEFPPIRSIAELDRRQPHVAVAGVKSVGSNRVNVSVEIRESAGEGIQDLKLFRDGRVVGLDDLAKQPMNLEQGQTWRVTFQNIEVPTLGEAIVEFSAYAFNANGVKSETHRLAYTRPPVEPNPRRAFVIVVGVNAYQNQSWDLRYAAEDARATSEIIARHVEASGQFEEVHTVCLIAERDESGAITGTATRAALLTVLDVLAGESGDPELLGVIPNAASLSKARPDDLVYLAFSGHGLSGDNGLFHLFLSDIGEGGRREVNSDLLARTLDSDLLAEHLRRVDAGNFVMVIDACNSAASVEAGGFKPGPMGSRGLGQLAYDKAMRVLAASQAEAVALESPRLRHGLLTFAMLHEGLAGGAADRAPKDSTVDFSELLSYGVERVPLLYEDIRSGSFAPQGRGLTSQFRPNARVAAPSVTQRPSLFDYSRDEWDIRLPLSGQGSQRPSQ